MKKILGILLAVCFLMSVTAAAVSADKVTVIKPNEKKGFHPGDKHGPKFIKVCTWQKPHMEKKVIKNVVYKHHKKVVTFKTVWIKVPGKMVCKMVPVKAGHNNDHKGPRR
jgi:hypothetical protein